MIAYGRGGARETVIPHPTPGATGLFFDHPSPEALGAAIGRFEAIESELKPEDCRRNAERFARERFVREFESTMNELWDSFQRGAPLE